MEIKLYVLGPIQTNTYLLIEENEAILIDPASKAEKLIEILGDLDLKAILLTHGHFDHIKAVDGLYKQYHCPVFLHEDDEELARDKYSGREFGLSAYITCPTIKLKEGPMSIGLFNFETIFTPGHTPGSVIFKFDDCLFTGDTLFKNSIGRTDLPGGNFNQLKASLRYFKELNKNYLIYPGHEEITDLENELNNNYFLQF